MTLSGISKFNRELITANEQVKPLKVEVEKGRLRIRVRRKDINFTKYTFDANLDGLQATVAICRDILNDYYRGCFDATLVKYGLAKVDTPKLTEVINLPLADNREPNLLEIWNSYKELKQVNSALVTQESWCYVDNKLSECPSECLLLSNADKLLAWLRTKYKDTSIRLYFNLLSSAVNLSIKLGKIKSNNPFGALLDSLVLPARKQISAFSKPEIKIIIQAFKDSRFDDANSQYPSSYYAGLVEFRFLTGCRPSEARALTWDDIKDSGDKMQIIFNKRISARSAKNQIPQSGTKNGVDARIFLCNKQLTNFIRGLPRIPNKHNLVFPGYKGGVISTDNFSKRIWSKYIKELVSLGLVKEYLPFYDERHTYTTHIARSGKDLKTISSVVGNSVKTLISNYLAPNEDIELPEI
jgi:integrase